jgi:uroporphyrinogen-III synthase
LSVFANVLSAEGDATDLARLIAARAGRGRPLLYLAGEDRAADLDTMLAPAGVTLATVVVYRTVAELGLPPALHEALAADAIDGVLHYSRRSADAFVAAVLAAQIDLKSLETRHFCISAEVAEVFRRGGIDAVAVAAVPDQDALLALIG